MLSVRFWALLSELNNLTVILSLKCPEYADRVNKLKEELTDIIDNEMNIVTKIKKENERASYRNN